MRRKRRIGSGFGSAALLSILAVLSSILSAETANAPVSEEEIATQVFSQAKNYLAAFQHPETHVLYGSRLSGKDTWTSPDEVKRELPEPWGYGSRIADTVLHTGHMLVAMLDACEAGPDPFLRAEIGKLFSALQLIGSLPETHPKPDKPALEGLVPRGPHPDDLSAYYDDASMDQHTTYIIALALYAKSSLAGVEEKAWIRNALQKAGRRLEQNDWSIKRADGVTEAHVGFSWKGFNSNHASILLPSVLALYHGTRDPHWLQTYESFLSEKNGERWKQMHAGPHVQINGHPIYANQTGFRLNAWYRLEDDPDRKTVIRELLKQCVTIQLERDFPGEFYRKYETAERWNRVRTDFAWDDAELRGCDIAWNKFTPSMLDHEDAGLAALAHVRFPLGGFHMVLLSENPKLIRERAATIWKMLRTVDLDKIDAGETHYLFTVVGLHLYAALHREPELFAATAANPAPTEESDSNYGRELTITHNAGIGPVADVAIVGDRAYAIGRSKLYVLDISGRGRPENLGSLPGLGNVRQIVVRDEIAYITSREDGLFIVDASAPDMPRLLHHYDTVEFATGIALAGDVLFVACRNFGVELIDVSAPENPLHLSTVRTGEAQSITVRNGMAYAGVWASSEVVVIDARDPRRPAIVDRVELDGFGDGVDVAGDFLFAATGHHSRERPNRDPGDPGFGRGHGLEIFDIRDPAHPKFVSRVKFPPFYHIGNDTWRVSIANGHAFVADTHNGVFVVDVNDPSRPKIVRHRQLSRATVKGNAMASAAGGLALTKDIIYVAGGATDLHVMAAPDLALVPGPEPDVPPALDRSPSLEAGPIEGARVYRTDGQVHAVDFLEDDRAVVACGSAGVHILRIWPKIERLSILETEGFATDVCVSGSRILVAEGSGGLSLCQLSRGGELRRVARHRAAGHAIRQVEVPGNCRYAFALAGSNRLQVIDIGTLGKPELVLEDIHPGLLYGDQIMRGLEADRYACVFWHVSGLHWYDIGGDGPPSYTGDNYPERTGSPNGLAAFQGKTLATLRGGFVVLDRSERRPLTELDVRTFGKREHLGKPLIHEDRLYTANRADGLITIAGISDPEKPVLIEQFETAGNPGRPVVRKGALVIPDGYNGLLVFDHKGKH